jgi:hypothetical protein
MTISAGKGEREREREREQMARTTPKNKTRYLFTCCLLLTEPAWVLVQQHMKLIPFPSKKMVSSNLK